MLTATNRKSKIERGGRNESTMLVRQNGRARGGRAGAEDSQPARRRRAYHAHGHLRVRPASVRRVHTDDAEGRHTRTRVYGRGGRDGECREEFEGGRSRRRAVPDCVRQLLLLS